MAYAAAYMCGASPSASKISKTDRAVGHAAIPAIIIWLYHSPYLSSINNSAINAK